MLYWYRKAARKYSLALRYAPARKAHREHSWAAEHRRVVHRSKAAGAVGARPPVPAMASDSCLGISQSTSRTRRRRPPVGRGGACRHAPWVART